MKNDASSKKNIPGTSPQDTNTTQQNSNSKQNPPLLEKFFMDLLKDIYWAEKHLVESLPDMQKAATTDELQEAFEDHLFATQKHVSRLEKVFRLLGKDPEAKKCEAMSGLVKEAKAITDETKQGTMTRDVALIIAAQKIEHYEIATYGSMVQLARTLQREDIASLLEKTLWEEEDTDQNLTKIAEVSINPLADEEGTDDDSTSSSSNSQSGNAKPVLNGTGTDRQYSNSTASMS